MKEAILISACLLGVRCRYDGGSKPQEPILRLMEKYTLIPVCPEQLGGLPTPRLPSERIGAQVVMKDGTDVTAAYRRGAEEALRLARLFGCRRAVLKERSPSCGSGTISATDTASRQHKPGCCFCSIPVLFCFNRRLISPSPRRAGE